MSECERKIQTNKKLQLFPLKTHTAPAHMHSVYR